MILEAACELEAGILEKLKEAVKSEESPLGKSVLRNIESNAELASKKRIPMCQDTGMVVVFLEIGSEVIFRGDLEEAVNEGVRRAYTEGYLRKSVVRHPLERLNTRDNTPAIIHTRIVSGDSIKISLAPKGAGSENVSFVKILPPGEGEEGIKKTVVEAVLKAGGKPCPPIIVGVGIGGNLEKAALLAKEALLRDIDDEAEHPLDRKLERELLEEINKTGIGPMGFGGTVTALTVKVNSYPCHIASLPVAVNFQCHAARHRQRII
ncbi:MAG TPA: fumarate hydratase, partial [Acholeplasmataceae bacterium]|nr:fumarate hydratase [Acholeplasmataceae bacterium]